MSDPDDPGGAGTDTHPIVLTDEQTVGVDVRALERVAAQTLGALGVRPGAELSIVLAGTERMAELKERWMGEHAPTDVLAFPMEDDEMLGDVVLCPEVAASQADGAGHPLQEELTLLLVHGILHLLGHDHAEPGEKAIMWSEQDRILARAGVGVRSPEDAK